MDSELLRAYLERVPFIPFRIEKTGGVWLEVRHPALASVSRRVIELAMPIENNRQGFITIAMVHVLSVEIDLPAPPN